MSTGNPDNSDDRLSQIATQWSALLKAHGADDESRQTAIEQLIVRYQSAAFRYILVITGDPETTEEVCQEFSLRFCRGAFRTANPEKGRFREFLKRSLINLVHDHHRANRNRARQLETYSEAIAGPVQSANEDDAEFISAWREELLRKTWNRLQQEQDQNGGSHYTVLRWKSKNPQAPSAEMAVALTTLLTPNKPYSDVAIRQMLKRSRERFGEFLIDEVAGSLQRNEREAIEEELITLDLLQYCKTSFEQYFQDH